MRYLILGPLKLLDHEDRPVAIGTGRERTVLAALLLAANRVVSADRLIELLWGDEPPASAGNALQVSISRLRKILARAGADGALQTRSPGYVLTTEPGDLDVEKFEQLVAPDAQGSPPEPAATAKWMSQALGLWRGEVLEGLDLGPIGRSDVTRLEDLRIGALERRIDAELALGAHRNLTGELEALAQTYPLREGFRGQLMLALYRSGRQADALATYRATRELLADELGIDPGPALQELEVAILRQAPGLELEPPPAPQPGSGQPATAPGDAPERSGPLDRVPLPARLTVRPMVEVVGRDRELATVVDAYKRVAGGDGRELLLVAGEAGLGKTTLAAAAARAAFDAGACVLFGHSEEDVTRPYQYFAEALGQLVVAAGSPGTGAPDSPWHDLLRRHASELVRLLPSLTTMFPELPPTAATDPDTERYLLFAAVTSICAELSHHQPVVLVFDDLQWADKGSLLLLRHLAGAEHLERVLVLATFRDTELVHASALRDTLGALRRHAGVGRIDLAGLSDADVVSYFEHASGVALEDDGVELAHAVYRETDGNPFFVGEVLRHLAETGAIRRDAEGRWTAGEALARAVLPDSVREVVGGRVVRLGSEAERLLSLAAVVGREFDLDLLAGAAGVGEDEVLDVLDGARAAALVSELSGTPGRFQFTHALIQHTLYDDLGATRRARWHRQIAEALEKRTGTGPTSGRTLAGGVRAADLARHWVAAIQPVDLGKAIEYSRLAGDEALAALAPADAVRFFSQALELGAQSRGTDPLSQLDTTIGLGTAMRQAGDPAFRTTLLEAARQAIELADTDRLVAAALANDRGTFSTVSAIDQMKVDILERALAQVPDTDVRRALLLATLCTELTVGSSLERREALADEAIDIAERLGDDATIARVISHVLLPLGVPHLLDVSVARSVEGLRRAERVGDPMLLCTAASGRRLVAGATGDVAEMDRCFEVKRPFVEQLNLPYLRWVHTMQQATRCIIAGDPDAAEAYALEALQLGTDGGQPDAVVVFGTQQIMVNLVRGAMTTVVPLLEQVVADNPGMPVFAAVLTLAQAESGHEAEARRSFEGLEGSAFRLPLDVAWLTGMIAYGDAAAVLGDERFAGPILDQLAPFADQWLGTDLAATGPVGRTVGDLKVVLGHHDEAEPHFAAAAASAERAGARFFAANVDLSWGRMCTLRGSPGDHERARDLLLRARHEGATRGYGAVERRAAELIGALPA